MNKIRRGDRVTVHTGRDKGKQGTVLAVLAEHMTVEDVNVAKKHMRPNPMLGTTGDMVDRVMPIHISNITLVDADDKSSRVGVEIEGSARTRVLKTIGAAIGA